MATRTLLRILWVIVISTANSTWLEAREAVRIAMVLDGPSEKLELFATQVERETQDLLGKEYDLSFLPLAPWTGDWTMQGVAPLLEKALTDPTIDIVVALGVLSTDAVTRAGVLPKPAFAPFVIDAALQGFVDEDGHSRVLNLNYLTFPTDIPRDLKLYSELMDLKHITFMVEGAIHKAIPEASPTLVKLAQELGIEGSVVPVENSIEVAVQAVPPNSDAVYLLPQAHLSPDVELRLIQRLKEQGLPVFVLMGRSLVDAGALATTTPGASARRLSRRLALNIQRVLSGEQPHDLPVIIPADDHLIVNMNSAQELGIAPPWSVLLEAELIHTQQQEQEQRWSLLDCIQTAMCGNRQLLATQRGVQAGYEDYRKAKARLLPQVEVGSLSRIIDEDRGRASFGLEPERAVFGSAKANQVLYSNRLMGNVCVQRDLQRARCDVLRSQELDTVLDVSRAYLNLLRAHTLENIQRNNLKFTRSNLRVAQQRKQVGIASASEVYRWESQIASNRTEVVKAHYAIRSLEVILNRLMNRCQEAPIAVDEVSLDEPYWLIEADWFDRHVSSDRGVTLLSDFAVCESLRLSPEIHQMRDQLRARAHALGIATRAFWTPDFILAAEFRDRVAEGGAGTRLPALANSTDWAVGINVTFPLYEGGAKSAERRQASRELMQQKAQLEAVSEIVEQRVRTSIYQASASYTTIGLAQSAADTARKNLFLVSESYSKGTAAIIDLLDAQNQALVAELVAANAVYDFLIDILSVQRTIGRYDFMLTSEEREEILARLNSFFLGVPNA